MINCCQKKILFKWSIENLSKTYVFICRCSTHGPLTLGASFTINLNYTRQQNKGFCWVNLQNEKFRRNKSRQKWLTKHGKESLFVFRFEPTVFWSFISFFWGFTTKFKCEHRQDHEQRATCTCSVRISYDGPKYICSVKWGSFKS